MILGPVKLIGIFVAAIALNAGLSIWFVGIMIDNAWTQTHRKTARGTPIPISTKDAVIPIVIAAAVSVALHGIGWIARNGMARRPIGMSVQFWKVLYYTAYVIGLIGGGIVYFAMPR